MDALTVLGLLVAGAAGVAVGRWQSRSCNLVTTEHLREMEERIMSKFTEYATDQKAFNVAQAKAIDELVTSITGVADDVRSLNDKILELLNAPGNWTPEEEALAVELRNEGAALVSKTEAAAAAVKTLDDQTPPIVPPPPPV